jgi:hypothetical protein
VGDEIAIAIAVAIAIAIAIEIEVVIELEIEIETRIALDAYPERRKANESRGRRASECE